MKDQYKADYKQIIDQISDMCYFAFGIENEQLKTIIGTIFLATLDGLAIQTSLGLMPENKELFIDTFNAFFAESIPAFLAAHLEKQA